MKICIIGIGYVGLPSGACLAQKGHEIILVDVDQEKVDKANKREPILYEKGLEEILKSVPEDKFKAVLGLDNANKDTDLFFICVGTPSKTDGGVDLRYIWKVAEQIGKLTKDSDKYFVVCVRSTVPPETTEKVGNLIEKTSGKKAGVDFGLAMNPEFLQEGKAVENFLNPTRQIFGGLDEKSLSYLEEAYAGFDCPKIKTDLNTAEMTK